MFNPVELIIKKRNGNELTREEIKFFIESYLKKEIPEYQMSAMLMAIFFKGMIPAEVRTLTEIYIESGKRINFPNSLNTVDKHSTGGVGDKITLMLAPIVAACGVSIPMFSGRGLGHTGGTLDKLESIPGFRTDLSDQDFVKLVENNGLCIVSQSEELVPADRHIYALRDVTGTVESLALITASIMSKKIAEGAQNLVIDLKVGEGAFIKNIEKARELGKLLKNTGENLGQKVSVIFTNMNAPLGEYIGNGLEIKETIEYLKGKELPDIDVITKALAVEMLLLAGKTDDEHQALEMVKKVIQNGKALQKFKELITAQYGNGDVCENLELLPQAKYKIPIKSKKSGWIKSIDSQSIGYALVEIDAGRKMLDSKLNYGTGAKLFFKIGDKVETNQLMGYIYSDNEKMGKTVSKRVEACYKIVDSEVEKERIILGKL